MAAKIKKWSWYKKILLAIALVGLAFIVYFIYQTTVLAKEQEKVTFCHTTGVGTWEELTTSPFVVFRSGHTKHDADIIPPFNYWVKVGRKWVEKHYDGKNWPRGQEILENGCVIPKPPPEQCEVKAYSCEACQNDPNEYAERLGVCYDKFVNYCGETYGCDWVFDCPINGPATHLTEIECKREWICKDTCEPEPTPTPEPTPSPEPEPVIRSEPGPAGAPPVCVGADLGDWAPTITEVGRIDSDTVYACWTKSTDNANDYVVWYGTSEDNLPWNTIVVDSECVELNDVPNTHIWLKVAATDNCVVGPYSTVVDP